MDLLETNFWSWLNIYAASPKSNNFMLLSFPKTILSGLISLCIILQVSCKNFNVSNNCVKICITKF